MIDAGPIDTLVLQEFHLHEPDLDGSAARLVAGAGTASAVPLLTSIDDHRDVATVRALRAGESPGGGPGESADLDRLVALWQPVQLYAPRVAEHSQGPPSYHRLAVTGSGIGDDDGAAVADEPRSTGGAGWTRLGLLWIGVPLDSHAGLLVLLGTYGDERAPRPDPQDWPLPLSRTFGVRIYESAA